MIRTYQTEHGGLGFALIERRRRARTFLMALAVITATAISAATLVAFYHRTAGLARADINTSWTP